MDSPSSSNLVSLPRQSRRIFELTLKLINDMYRKCQFPIHTTIHMYRKNRFLGHMPYHMYRKCPNIGHVLLMWAEYFRCMHQGCIYEICS